MHSSPAFVENPFATRHTRPGRLRFLFSDGSSAESLISHLREHHWWGEVIGPHGSGKSSLLAALRPLLADAGRDLVSVELHDGQRRLPSDVWRMVRWSPHVQLVIDGYEQLFRWERWRIKRRCRIAGCGLLVTAHASVGLPLLYRTKPDFDLALRVVNSLSKAIPAHEVEACFRATRGDLREMLFALYDHFEQRR